jgi:hypothetical protein
MRESNKLTARKIATLEAAGMYADGHGLYLDIRREGNRSWVFRYKVNKRERFTVSAYRKPGSGRNKPASASSTARIP